VPAAHFSVVIPHLSCSAEAEHPVTTNVSVYWIVRWSLPSGRPRAGPEGGR
jgi:hypothetical protein